VPSSAYRPRSPADVVLYQIVRDHFETFRAQAGKLREGEGLPAFVEHAFRQFLRCGWLAGGFARFRCQDCSFDRLVPFSCKGRARCPSCGGRRMTERAAHLVDRVFPDVPIRQWVLSVPFRLRYQLAWNHDLCREVAGLFVRAVFRVLANRARDVGIEGGRGGAVVVIQRFGGALNLNVHFHALVLDGVLTIGRKATPEFHRTRQLATLDVEEVLAAVEPLVERRCRAHAGDALEASGIDACADEAPLFAALAAASVQNRAALGAERGTRPRRLGARRGADAEPAVASCQARVNGFSVHAGVVVPAGQRERLERVCRYALRPPVAIERLQRTEDGRVRLSLRQPWPDGTTDLIFTPIALLERPAVLVPRPRINLVLDFGVLGARAAGRRGLAGPGPDVKEPQVSADPPPEKRSSEALRTRGYQWAELMARTFGIDVLACPRCGGRLQLIAMIEDARVIARLLRHLGVPTEVPTPRPARPPPADAWRDAWAIDTDDSAEFTPAS
jgi:Putative transposase/Transposase zinc-binding domain